MLWCPLNGTSSSSALSWEVYDGDDGRVVYDAHFTRCDSTRHPHDGAPQTSIHDRDSELKKWRYKEGKKIGKRIKRINSHTVD